MSIGPTEWLLILVIVVILFGGKKIPEIMKGLGQGIREFKKAKDDVTKEPDAGTGKISEGNKENAPKP